MASDAASKGGNANLIVTVSALTVLAVVGGGLVGKLTVARLHGSPATPALATTSAPLPYPSSVDVRELTPVVTNLAAPPASRVRLQAAIVYDKGALQEPGATAAMITDDIMAFLKTLSLSDLQGASGLQNLREDLNERASVRSQGKVHEVVIETLVVE